MWKAGRLQVQKVSMVEETQERHWGWSQSGNMVWVGPMVTCLRGLVSMNLNLAIHACIWQVRMGRWWLGLDCVL